MNHLLTSLVTLLSTRLVKIFLQLRSSDQWFDVHTHSIYTSVPVYIFCIGINIRCVNKEPKKEKEKIVFRWNGRAHFFFYDLHSKKKTKNKSKSYVLIFFGSHQIRFFFFEKKKETHITTYLLFFPPQKKTYIIFGHRTKIIQLCFPTHPQKGEVNDKLINWTYKLIIETNKKKWSGDFLLLFLANSSGWRREDKPCFTFVL